jgi:hypothetical protein
MTPSDEMRPGVQLDSLIAENVMGWKRGSGNSWVAPGTAVDAFHWRPSSSISDADDGKCTAEEIASFSSYVSETCVRCALRLWRRK